MKAINKKDYKNLKEELGDVLFNIILISQVAKEQKLFDIEEVINDVYDKIVERHPWVFGEDEVGDAEEALAQWKKNKEKK